MQWMTPASSTYWWSGVWGTSTNEFNMWFNYKGLSIKPGDTSISGNLNVAGRILIDGSHLNVQPKSSTTSGTLVFDKSFGPEIGSDSHCINVYGRQGGNSHLKFYNGRSGSLCNVLIDGNLDVGSVTIDAGSYKTGNFSVGDATAYESLIGSVNGFNLNPQTQMSFVACATNTDSTVGHIGLCCLNRASTYSSYTPAITFSAWGHYYGAELDHIGAIACQQQQIQGQRHIEGDMVFSQKIQLVRLERLLGFMIIKLQGSYPI